MVQKEVFFLRVSENEAGVCSEKLFGNKRALRDVTMKFGASLLNGVSLKETSCKMMQRCLVAQRLRPWWCHCCGPGHWCGSGSIPGPETPASLKHSQKKKKKISRITGKFEKNEDYVLKQGLKLHVVCKSPIFLWQMSNPLLSPSTKFCISDFSVLEFSSSFLSLSFSF